MLHHAILAFPEWQRWSDICGFQDRGNVSGAGDQIVRLAVENRDHPITKGLSSWEMTDEIYVLADVGEGKRHSPYHRPSE